MVAAASRAICTDSPASDCLPVGLNLQREPQAGQIHINCQAARGGQIKCLYVQQPVLDHSIDHRVQAAHSNVQGQGDGQVLLSCCKLQIAFHMRQEIIPDFQVPRTHGMKFADVFDFLRGDFKYAAGSFIA